MRNGKSRPDRPEKQPARDNQDSSYQRRSGKKSMKDRPYFFERLFYLGAFGGGEKLHGGVPGVALSGQHKENEKRNKGGADNGVRERAEAGEDGAANRMRFGDHQDLAAFLIFADRASLRLDAIDAAFGGAENFVQGLTVLGPVRAKLIDALDHRPTHQEKKNDGNQNHQRSRDREAGPYLPGGQPPDQESRPAAPPPAG